MFSLRLLIVAVIAVFSSTAQAPAQWTATESLPDTYVTHSMVHTQGYLYHLGGLGGTNGFLAGDKVFYAQVTGPGTIGPWVAGTTVLPEASSRHAAAVSGNYIYVLGGRHFDGINIVFSSDVYFSQIGPNGVPGAWQTTTPMPEPLFVHSAVVSNGRIYVIGGATPTTESDRVYSAEISPDGTLGSWVSLLNLPVPNFSHAAVVQDGAIYLLGGVINNGVDLTNTVRIAPILPDGTVGPWAMTTPLPTPLSDHGAVVISGRVYVVGGWTGAPTAAVHSAQILPDKTLGAWQSEPSMPQPLTFHAGATDGLAIFASGGWNDAFDQSAVYGLPVAPPLSLADFSGPLGPGVPDGCVDAFDLGLLLGAWCSSAGDPDPPGDIDPPCEGCLSPNFGLADISGPDGAPDGCVDAFDLAKLLNEWCSVAGGNLCGTCGP
ncbi:MAG: hypothetical protein IH983_10980 [Planctomycetes bacterium]|nr:hypothetical protein [Planctomycetota bacterium]